MRTRDLLAVGAWALSTVAVLAVVSPVTLDAKSGSGSTISPAIETPTLKANGCELSLDWVTPPAKDGMKPGQAPAIKLTVLNPGTETASCSWAVHLFVTPPSNPMARVVPSPKDSWSHEDEYSLLPGERKVVTLHPDKALAAGERGSFVIQSKGQSINALSMFVKPAPQAKALPAMDLAPQQSALVQAVRNAQVSKQ